MTNYTHLVIDVEKEFGPENLLEHLDDPRIKAFRRKLDRPDTTIHPAMIKVIQFDLDSGYLTLDDVARNNSISQTMLTNMVIRNELSLKTWSEKNPQLKQAQRLLDKGKKQEIHDDLGMSYTIINFLYKYNYFDHKAYLNAISVSSHYDIKYAQKLLDQGVPKRRVAKSVGISTWSIDNEINKGNLRWVKKLPLYER
ncbi:hypothetical protein [Lactobacillus terrae]|uniref:hypothetical protein n=1 Tax=Lactobacillus terrae TaxID=2269374 RepID=UPI000C1B68BE|nr:hypothetical protein [Lactobacillus terrae]